MALKIICAVDNVGGFARNHKLPWDIKEDMQAFRATTLNHVCVMGYNTYKEILQMKAKKKPKQLLADRKCYVVSSRKNETFHGATRVSTLSEVLDMEQEAAGSPTKHIFVLGGERMYREAISRVTEVILTIVDDNYNCDQFFPIHILSESFAIITGKKIVASNGVTLYTVTYHNKE